MPFIESPTLIQSEQDRLRVFLEENRIAAPEPTEQDPGLGATFAAAGRTQNTLGSFVTNRVGRIMAGYSPLYGGQMDFDRNFDPSVQLSDPEFYIEHPYALNGYERLAAAKDAGEFDLTLQQLRQVQDDFETVAASGWSGVPISLAVNIADPTNLIPYGLIARTAKGVGTAKLIQNVAKAAAIGGTANVLQEEALRGISPGQPIDRAEADLVAAGFGIVFGGTIGFLAAPNFKPKSGGGLTSMGADLAPQRIPTAKLMKIRERVEGMFNEPSEVGGQKPRNFVTAIEDSEIALRQMLKEKPEEGRSLAVLFRRDNPEAGIEADANGKLVQQIQHKYDKAGIELNIERHPLQDDFDAFSPLERSLNDAAVTVRRLESESTGAKQAQPADTADTKLDRVVMEGNTFLAKAAQVLTPARAFEKSILDMPSLLQRTFLYDGTISRAGLSEGDYKGPVPAEALKENYTAIKDTAIREIREAYDPSRELGMLFSRDADDSVSFTGFQKVAAKFKRKPIEYVNAAGERVTIPAYAHYTRFGQEAVNILREQKAFDDGFAAENLQKVPPQLQKAVDAIRRFNDEMLDLGDQAGVLPGPRSLADAQARLDKAAEELRIAEDDYRKTEGILTEDEMRRAIDDIDSRIDDVNPEDAQAMRERRAALQKQLDDLQEKVATVYSNVPKELKGRVLFDWGSKGLRIEGSQGGPIRIEGQRARSFWDNKWNRDLKRVHVPNPQIVRALREVTDEIWPVLERRGKFWSTRYYLAPEKAIQEAEQLAARKARSAAEGKLMAAQQKHADIEARTQHLEQFQADAQNYFTRRFIRENVLDNKDGFKSYLKRSWQRSRNIGTDPETGNIIRLNDADRPILDEVREQLKIGEQYRTEGDLMEGDFREGTDLHARYSREVDAFFERSAESTWATITDPLNGHGVDRAFTNPSPLMHRRLTLDESDPSAGEFLDADPERVLTAYLSTVGGRIANQIAIERAEPLLKQAGLETRVADRVQRGEKLIDQGERLVRPDELIDQLRDRYNELANSLEAVDREAGTGHATAVKRDAARVLRRLTRRMENVEGRGVTDPTSGANAMWTWGGRQLLSMNYLALLGSQTLAAINDAAGITLFTDITSVPKNVRYMLKAMAPLKKAARRDLELMRLAFEGEHARVLALGDVDFDNAMGGVGFGATRQVTAAIGAGTQNLSAAFNELSLINSWNRYIKRAAAMIAMDRFVTHSRRLIRANALMAKGTKLDDALRQVGLSRFDYARLRDVGINAETARHMMDLIRRYGTDENGKPLMSLNHAEWENYKGLALPNAGEWLKAEGDKARAVYDTYLAAINGQVEHAMVITPTLQDKPLINDHWWGRAINQFQQFNMSWANQVARPLAQRPAGRQMAGVLAYFGTGALVDAIRNHLSSRRDFDETARLWMDNPLGMTYAVVNTSGLSGWFNRPLAFFDKVGWGPGAMLGNQNIARAAYQSRTFWGSLSPTADFVDRSLYGAMGVASGDPSLSHWHALRKSVPMQNLIWFRLNSRLTGIDPLVTEKLMQQRYEGEEPRP